MMSLDDMIQKLDKVLDTARAKEDEWYNENDDISEAFGDIADMTEDVMGDLEYALGDIEDLVSDIEKASEYISRCLY